MTKINKEKKIVDESQISLESIVSKQKILTNILKKLGEINSDAHNFLKEYFNGYLADFDIPEYCTESKIYKSFFKLNIT